MPTVPPMLRRLRRLLVELLLWVAALAGLTAVVLVICAHVFGLSLILFRTGSMEPTIPQGSASLVREIPAADVAVGDVVTVDRAGQLPVTHRVTSVRPGEAPAERVITMQGDANASEDPRPYTVTEVRRVLWSVPGLAAPIHRLSDPWVMGTVTVGAALLVGWAFWPHRSERPADTGHDADGHEDPEGATPRQHGDETSPDGSAGRARPRHAAPPTAAALLIGAVGVIGPGVEPAQASTTSPAMQGAATEVDVVTGEHLRIVSALRPETARDLAPGEVVVWELEIAVDAPDPGEVRTGLSSTGRLPLEVVVESCGSPWGGTPQEMESLATSSAGAGEGCAADRRLLLDGATFGPDSDTAWFSERPADQDRWLRVQVSLPDGSAEAAEDVTSRLRMHVEAGGESLVTSPGGADSSEAPGTPGSGDESPDSSTGESDGTGGADGADDDLATTGAPVLILVAAGLLSMGLGHLLRNARAGRRDG